MKKFCVISLIVFLILTTAYIKNSSKRIEENIFITKENLRRLNKEFDIIKLEYEYLSSAEKLIEFQNLYFDEELENRNIKEFKIINNKLDIFKLINE